MGKMLEIKEKNTQNNWEREAEGRGGEKQATNFGMNTEECYAVPKALKIGIDAVGCLLNSPNVIRLQARAPFSCTI